MYSGKIRCRLRQGGRGSSAFRYRSGEPLLTSVPKNSSEQSCMRRSKPSSEVPAHKEKIGFCKDGANTSAISCHPLHFFRNRSALCADLQIAGELCDRETNDKVQKSTRQICLHEVSEITAPGIRMIHQIHSCDHCENRSVLHKVELPGLQAVA